MKHKGRKHKLKYKHKKKVKNMKYGYKNACTHEGAKKAFQIGTCTVYGGGEYGIKPDLIKVRPIMVVSLLGDADLVEKRKPIVRYSKVAAEILPTTRNVKVGDYTPKAYVVMDWSDNREPPVPPEFWHALVKDLQTINGNVIFYCMGGHGRTGTALSIIAGLSGASGQADPVKFVREVYCHEAVESQAQLDYIRSVGLHTRAKPAKGGYTATTYDYGGGSSFPYSGSGNSSPPAGTKGKCCLCPRTNAVWDNEAGDYLCDDCWRQVGLKA